MTDAPAASPTPLAAAPVRPGRVLGIVAFILAFLPWLQVIALILGIVAKVQSKKAGLKNGFAVWAIILSIVFLVLLILLVAGGAILCATGAATCTGSVG
jgi:hypothetical protein